MVVNFGGVDGVLLQGAIIVCYGGRGRVVINFGKMAVVPLLCHWQDTNLISISILFLYSGFLISPEAQENNHEFYLELLANITLFFVLIKKIFLVSGVYTGFI